MAFCPKSARSERARITVTVESDNQKWDV
ncbi:hypothetical protein D9613_012940 [Agrocybe pediades]|uniref:Uncharacterized protein n=1 Tax=Agrocybe pediades TaxID=84607 RepID=A0A8H4QEY7_9AGAR|nr:hypothetical protein D9613_012940 [Agrocybe pediades]